MLLSGQKERSRRFVDVSELSVGEALGPRELGRDGSRMLKATGDRIPFQPSPRSYRNLSPPKPYGKCPGRFRDS
jgi:hypothetical protein